METQKKQDMQKIDTRADVVNQYTGDKWYYSDIVKDHFFNPRNLMLEDPDESQYDAVGMVGSPACILSTTCIQKNPSLTAIVEAKVGDLVMSHDGHFYEISRIFKPEHSGKLVKLKNQLGEIIATRDHLLYALQIPRKADSPFVHTKYKKRILPSWIHADDLEKGDFVMYPIPKEERHNTFIHVPLQARKKWDFKSISLPSRIPINAETLELFGYFVAEGHSKKQGDSKEIGFTFSITENCYVQRVVKFIKKYFGLNATVKSLPENNRINISVYNIYLNKLFRELFGESAATKRVPEWLLFLGPELQRFFLKGLWRGDGYFSALRNQPRAGYATISKTLLHQVVWLLLRQKIVPSIYREPAKQKNGVFHQPSYRIHVGDMLSLEHLAEILAIRFKRDQKKRHAVECWFDDNYLYMPIRGKREILFSGRLMNLEVDGAHTYTTDAFLVHNCGDMMKMWLKFEPKTEKIKEMKWRTFGCGSAIAATSMFSVMVTENGGLLVNDALKVKPQHIMERLGGLPNRKIHCSVLADKAFRKAVNDYFRRTKQYDRIIIEGARVVDQKLNITDKDIEEAVLEGAMDLDGVQKKLKVGVGSPEVITEVEQLIRFYKEKYYG